jgi:phosphohistidine phosphatase
VKTLLILRHAKSSWKYESLPDHERPLNRRGVTDAPRMGQLLLEAGLTPDRIVSSTAVRAQSTARLAGEACGYEGSVALREDLYLSGSTGYLEALRQLPAEINRAMIVGHNPDVEELVHLLTGRDVPMPTAALAQVELPIDDWTELDNDAPGKLHNLWRPRDL